MSRVVLLPAVKSAEQLLRYCVENFRRITNSLNQIEGSRVPVGGIIAWSGAIADIPDNWALCDGTLGTPNLKDRFVVGAGNNYAVGATGGADSVTLSTSQMPGHFHTTNAHDHAITKYTGGSTSSVNRFYAGQTFGSGSTDLGNSNVGVGSAAPDTNFTGGGGSHENRPPYYALAWIMRVA